LPVQHPCRFQFPTTVRSTICTYASQALKKAASDGIFNYASTFLNDGLLPLELKDAIRGGDGE